MVRNNQPDSLSLEQAAQLRDEMGGLLSRLLADREMSEKRQAEAGKRDPLKSITGRTAFDNAIASTRDMLTQMESLVSQLHSELPADSNFNGNAHDVATVHVVPRPTVRNGVHRSSAVARFRPLPVSSGA